MNLGPEQPAQGTLPRATRPLSPPMPVATGVLGPDAMVLVENNFLALLGESPPLGCGIALSKSSFEIGAH